jgi:hypothetical protein
MALTHGVNNEVHPLAIGGFEDLFSKVLSLIVESSGCTELVDAEVNLLLTRGCGVNRGGTMGFRKLDGCDPNTRRTSVDEDLKTVNALPIREQ